MKVSTIAPSQTYGFCRIRIPKGLMPPPHLVIIDDGLTEVLHFNNTAHDDETHRWIYFAYEHSTHEIIVIPQFPPLIVLPLLVAATLLATITLKRAKLVATRP
jgi:hypothetical protein